MNDYGGSEYIGDYGPTITTLPPGSRVPIVIPKWSDEEKKVFERYDRGQKPSKSHSASFDYTPGATKQPPTNGSSHSSSTPHGSLEKRDIQTGDLLFFSGEDYQSKIIEMGTASRWSHVATAVDLFDDTLDALRNFMKYMPQNWRDIAGEVAKVTIAHNNGGAAGVGSVATPTTTSTLFEPDSMITHISQVMVVHALLRNNKHVKAAVYEECQYLEGLLRLRHGLGAPNGVVTPTSSMATYTPRNDGAGSRVANVKLPPVDDYVLKTKEIELLGTRMRRIYLWESTTSKNPNATCLLTGRTGDGVKLTLLDDRAGGYQGIVGRRSMKISTHLDSSIAAAATASQLARQTSAKVPTTSDSARRGNEKIPWPWSVWMPD